MFEEDVSVRGLLLDIDRFAVHDGPGIRTSIYLKGCPLHCAWCHSPESMDPRRELIYLERKCTGCGLCLDVCPRTALAFHLPGSSEAVPPSHHRVVVDWQRCDDCGACAEVCYPGALKMAGEWKTAGELVGEIEKDAVFFKLSGGGVTLTGGEATRQPDFCYQVLSACRQRGIHTALETNGFAPGEVMNRLGETTDLILFDLKLIDEDQHRRWTGVSNRTILANLKRISETDTRIIVRVPCIPGISDTIENISATVDVMKQLHLKEIHILPYNTAAGAKYLWMGKPYTLEALTGQSAETLAKLADICTSAGLIVKIGG